MKQIKQVLGGDLRQYTMVLALAVLIIFFNVISDGRMLTSSNFQNLLSGNAYVLILALGMLMVIVIGQIDLSVGSVAGFSAMAMCILAQKYELPWFIGVLIAIAIGLAIGAWHGFFLAKLGIPGFITTLGGMLMFRGGVIWISKSISVPAPEELRFFGSGYLPEWGPTFTGMNNSTLLLGIIAIVWYIYTELKRYKSEASIGGDSATPLWAVVTRVVLVSLLLAYFTWLFGSGREGTSFPVPGLILLILIFIYHTITQKTTFGRHVYAVGGNKNAAALSGVNVSRTYFLTMMNMSLLSAIAGVLFVGRSTAAGPADGTSWEMDAIASVFIGGAAVSGGVGTILATVVGGLVMAVLNNGLMLMGVGADKTQVIKGLVLLAAVAVDVYNKNSGRSSIIGKLFPSKESTEKKEG
ncbi:MAG: sugar ABC transporter permease [Lachnospiraceae bacterium]|nr:sugar ABC transporter permease [Lachnospiraceae bacterium]